ncbi:CEP70 [Branchiostoma lanceolatum]|uniref:Centrosomal protein of 70 kDa n=1 Tax=Branchiostoma lanceolatum TaxID=7740 RepID=A0A8J9YTD7_BRALA|nr:CEP70 [Branchiostoma lanceolatum]
MFLFQTPWSEVNQLLKEHGLPVIVPVQPGHGALSNSKDVIVLDSATALSLRDSLKSLMQDCDRRQVLIQDLILTNNQLKEKVGRTTAAEPSHQLHQLQQQLKESQAMAKTLDREKTEKERQHRSEVQLLQDRQALLDRRCRELETTVQEQRQRIHRMKAKIKLAVQEEEKRLQTQTGQHEEPQQQTTSTPGDGEEREKDVTADILSTDYPNFDATVNYKALLKSYEAQLEEKQKHVGQVTAENRQLQVQIDQLQEELNTRPQKKELQYVQHRLTKAEKVLAQNNLSLSNRRSRHNKADSRSLSTEVSHIPNLPIDVCRQWLEAFASRLKVDDLQEGLRHIRALENTADRVSGLEKFADEVKSIVEDKRAPALEMRQAGHSHAAWCEKSYRNVLPKLKLWLHSLSGIKHLQDSVAQLAGQVVPWDPSFQAVPEGEVCPSTTDIARSIDDITKKVKQAPHVKGTGGAPSAEVLQTMVGHFQKLFDVPKLNGVYVRMNQVYSRLGEMQNMMNSLREALKLDKSASCQTVVDRVVDVCEAHSSTTAQQLFSLLHTSSLDRVVDVCEAHSSTTAQQLYSLLHTSSLDSVLDRLQQYDKFFPAFHHLVQQLQDILEIDNMEHIVPAVRALKLLS